MSLGLLSNNSYFKTLMPHCLLVRLIMNSKHSIEKRLSGVMKVLKLIVLLLLLLLQIIMGYLQCEMLATLMVRWYHLRFRLLTMVSVQCWFMSVDLLNCWKTQIILLRRLCSCCGLQARKVCILAAAASASRCFCHCSRVANDLL